MVSSLVQGGFVALKKSTQCIISCSFGLFYDLDLGEGERWLVKLCVCCVLCF